MFKKRLILAAVVALAFGVLVGCGKSAQNSSTQNSGDVKLSGTVTIDGSSTVYPISQAVSESFMQANPGVNVTVNESSSGMGLKKLVNGEIDIADASRSIEDKEKQVAAKNQIQPIEIPVGLDGIVVVVNKNNTFVDHLTVDELKKIWEPGSKVKYWSDVRPNWPKKPIKLFGPGTTDGTFEYFTEEIIGEKGKSRTDYTATEDDNVTVKGVASNKYGLGYFGFAYYEQNKDKLRAVKIDSGKGPVEPSDQTIHNGTYAPLSRKLYIYVSNKAMARPEVKAFVKFYLENAKYLVKVAGYVPLSDEEYKMQLEKVGK